MDNIFECLIGIITVSGLFGWIPVMVWWKHRIRLEEIRNQKGAGINEETIAVLRDLQRELRDLRETTTKFDMSFDSGLDRLEQRLNRVEERTPYRNGAVAVEEPQTLRVGNR